MKKQFIYILLATAALTAACSDDKKDEYKPETITNPVTDITVPNVPEDGVLRFESIGQTQQVAATASPANGGDADRYYFEYASSDEKVFTVTEDGTLTTVGPGEAVLTVTPVNNTQLKKTYKVVVLFYITDLQLSTTEVKLNEKEKYDLSLSTTIIPANATYQTLKYASSDETVATVNERGVVKALKGGQTTIMVSTTDGSNISKECTVKVTSWFDRTGWTVDTSARYATGNNYVVDNDTGKPEDILDGDQSTFLSLIKPGRTYAGCTAAKDDPFYFVVDMKESKAFNVLRWKHRYNNSSEGLRAKAITLSGSNDGTNYTVIQENITLPTANYTDLIEIQLPTTTYRYVKVDYTKWDTVNNNTVQCAEFELGNGPKE
ncbi:MAG: Ig-like domain-containing protein [Mediterranea sp.]|jgi:hypothetical protein|nr:Ig-like domain-containing protein [Mediterranea sp.]